MKNYTISLSADKEIHQFEIAEYPQLSENSCKYKVFQNGKLVACLEPDKQHFLHISQNLTGLDEEILHLLTDQIELQHPRNLKSVKVDFDNDNEPENL